MREILEHKLRKAEDGSVVLLTLLDQECKAHEETKRKLKAETEARRKAEQETNNLRSLLEQERNSFEHERKMLKQLEELKPQLEMMGLLDDLSTKGVALTVGERITQKGYQTYQTLKKIFS